MRPATLSPADRKGPAALQRIAADRPKPPEMTGLFARLRRQVRRSQVALDRLAQRHLREGVFRQEDGDVGRAAECFRKALDAWPQCAEAHLRLGRLWEEARERDLAVGHLRQALAIEPELTEAHFRLGRLQLLRGECAAANESFDRSLRNCPFDRRARHARGLLALQRRAWVRGWRDFQPLAIESLRGVDGAARWDGSSLCGKSLLVHCEGPLCDAVMFASCLEEVVGAADRTILVCDPRLAPLFRRSFPAAEVRSSDGPIPPSIDAQTRLESLPRYLRTSDESFGERPAWLKADAAWRRFWRKRLAADGAGPKVGLCPRPLGGVTKSHFPTWRQWAEAIGNQPLGASPRFSTEFGACGPRQIVGICSDARQRRKAQTVGCRVFDELDPLGDLEAFAGLLAELDLLVTLPGFAAHLAGALGTPVWTLLPHWPSWRWGLTGRRMPWYPTMRLYRQTSDRDWTAPLAELSRDLAQAGTMGFQSRRADGCHFLDGLGGPRGAIVQG